jgi:hypothetical protein
MRDGHHPARGAAPYLLLVLVLSLPLWAVGGALPVVAVGALDLPVSALMFVCPGAAAVLLAARRGGRASVWRVLRRVVEVRGRWGWVLLGTALVVGPAVTATALVGELAPWPVLPALLLCLVFLLPAAAEELGWAHLTDLWRGRLGTWGAGLAVGLVTVLWHLVPLWQAGNTWDWIRVWALSSLAARVVMTWCYVRAGARVPVLVAMHAAANVCAAVAPGLNTTAGLVANAAATVVVAAALALRSGYFTEPASTPCSKYFWNEKNTMSGTTSDRNAPVARMSMFEPN